MLLTKYGCDEGRMTDAFKLVRTTYVGINLTDATDAKTQGHIILTKKCISFFYFFSSKQANRREVRPLTIRHPSFSGNIAFRPNDNDTFSGLLQHSELVWSFGAGFTFLQLS
jgi:hypothetical protein